jgi:DNA-binding transcriptional MerR regulator
MELDNNSNKLYYGISEIAEMFDVNASVLRYWEKEFKQLKPIKNAKGERRYTKKDIELIDKIYKLIRDKGFTIEGAKKELINQGTLFETEASGIEAEKIIEKLESIKEKLLALK